ncbi:MAG: hypothetical protein SPI30_06020 [Prevotella sp.]|nr:hypothetical protein [Prevotella sp.]
MLDERTTNGWYSRYQALVRIVPAFGTRRTNEWYDSFCPLP